MKKHILECLNKENEKIYNDIYELENKDLDNINDSLKYQYNILNIENKKYFIRNDENKFNYNAAYEDKKKGFFNLCLSEDIGIVLACSILPIVNIFFIAFILLDLFMQRKNYKTKDFINLIYLIILQISILILSVSIFSSHFFLLYILATVIGIIFSLYMKYANDKICNKFKVLTLKDFTMINIFHNDSDEYKKIIENKSNEKKDLLNKKAVNRLDKIINEMNIPQVEGINKNNLEDMILEKIDFKIKEKSSFKIAE